MWGKIWSFLKKERQNVLVAILGVGLIGALVGFCIYASHQPNTFTIQTKNGPVTKTYYGSLDSVAAQEERDRAIATAETEGKSSAEARAIGQAEYHAWMQPSDFHIMEAIGAIFIVALLIALTPSGTDERKI
jgi:hypothetical protein